ncbi:MAG TPA: DMT family transporter [Thermoanaerobaculia bacterium]|nr:DMT family transporter [Thermoanaerobaculia bacterium]
MSAHDPAGLERRGVLYVLAAAILWSTGGVAIKAVDAGPLVISFYRSAIAAVVLFALIRPGVVRWSFGFIVAVISYAACLTTFVVATRWTTAANAIFLQYMGVIWVMVLAPLVLREPLRRRDAIPVAVAFAGMALFFVEKFDARGMAGNLFALLSSVFFGLLVVSLRAERDASAEAAVTWGNVLVAAALLPFVAGELRIDFHSSILLIFLGVFQIGFAYACFVRGLRYVSATQASLTGMLEPVMNPVWVLLFLGERPSPLGLLGGAIVLGAVTARTLLSGPPRPHVPPPD